ncbi:hypothetical protein [Tropicibacter alexandrii]|uniref:hypothetical protein n=1 Tax=Tropicibacter alexandrii TaxID=2267683 RepID=UPI000EF4D87A|nr:hypothetical protein [Tropicibacter alexandrii]
MASVFKIGADMIFRSQQGEGDLPQPVGGEARCYIMAQHGKSDPRPYRNRTDLEEVIAEEMRAIPKESRWWDPRTGLRELVEYYEDTTESYAGRLAKINAWNNEIDRRGGDDGLYSLAAALAA